MTSWSSSTNWGQSCELAFTALPHSFSYFAWLCTARHLTRQSLKKCTALWNVTYRLLKQRVQCVAVNQQIDVFLVPVHADPWYVPHNRCCIESMTSSQ